MLALCAALACAPGLASAQCAAEVEPNDAPETATAFDPATCLTGQIAVGDQEILRFSTSEPMLWQLDLQGIEGNETRLDLFDLSDDPAVAPNRIYTQVAGPEAPQIMLPPGDWMAGVSVAGDQAGTWTLTARGEVMPPPGDFAPDAPLSGLLAPFETVTLPFTVTPQMARRSLDLRLDVPPGSGVGLAIDGPVGVLTDGTVFSEGPILRAGIGLDAGDYALRLTAQTSDPLPFRLLLELAGRRLPTREDEPNDTLAAARPLLPGKPVEAALSVEGDVDLWQFEVVDDRLLSLTTAVPASAGKPGLDRVQTGRDGAGRQLCLRDAAGMDLQCRIGGALALDDLLLSPGLYHVAVFGPMEPEATYEIALRHGPKAAPGRETEPNDAVAQAVALEPGSSMQGTLTGQEVDRFALEVTGTPQLWRFEAHGVTRMRLEDPQGIQILQRDNLGAVRTLVIDDVMLTAGRHTVMLEGNDSSYSLTAEAKGPPPEGAESEPNDTAQAANLIRPGSQRLGRLVDFDDIDQLRFSLSQPAKLRLAVTISGGLVQAELTGPEGSQREELGDGVFEFPGDFAAGSYTLYMRTYDEGPVSWQVALDWRAVEAGDLPVTAALVFDAPATASHLPLAQRVTGLATLRNEGAQAVTLALSGNSVIPGAVLSFDPAEVVLEPGGAAQVRVTLTTPPDLRRDAASLVTVLATAAQGSVAANARLAISTDGLPAAPFAEVPPPPELRGGFNLASPAFGATIPGETAETLERYSSDNPKWLFDGMVGSVGFQAAPGAAQQVVFGPADPVPVAGFALTPHAILSAYDPSLLKDFEIALSEDGVTFATVLSGTLDPYPTEQYFVLPEPVAARAAELRLLSGTDVDGYQIDLAEWKVIAVPGQPPGVAINLADPRRGGHVVRLDPQPLVTPQDLREILQPVGDSMVMGGVALPLIVVGFADDRAARISEVRFADAPVSELGSGWGQIAVSVGDTALGPWVEVGQMPPPGAPDGVRVLRLDPAPRARFVRFAAVTPASDPVDWLIPAEIAVIEAVSTADAPSITGEWGMHGRLTGEDLTAPLPPPENDDPDDMDSAEAPRSLDWGGAVQGRVTLGVDEDFWAFIAPEGEDRAMITLTGAPTVMATVTAFAADGSEMPLRRMPPLAQQRRYELAVVAGETYVLRVTEPPRSIVVAVDVSGSLQPFWDTIRLGIAAFAEAPVPGRDFLRFLPFDGEFLAEDWTDIPDVMRRTLATMSALITGSGTEQTTITALQVLSQREGLRALVLMTDGATSSFSMKSQMWADLEESGVQVFSGHIGGWDDPVAEKQLLQDLATVGGGTYAHLQTQAELDVMLERTVDWLRRPARYGLAVARSDLPPPAPAQISVLAPPADGSAPVGVDGVSAPPAPEQVNAARPSVELVVDASGSMLQAMPQGGRRIDVAHRVLDDLIRNRLPEGTPVALRAFGDTEEGSCDTTLRAPLMPLVPDYLAPLAVAIEPVNLAKTPIAASLAATAEDLAGTMGPRVVVLVTDGEETCGGDPEAAIAALRASGVQVTVNIVGFALDDAALEATFTEWAEAGGGQYFPAQDEASLAASLQAATGEGFAVLALDGSIVASGLVGGAPVEVPSGQWQVVVGEGRVDFGRVELAEGESRALALPQD